MSESHREQPPEPALGLLCGAIHALDDEIEAVRSAQRAAAVTLHGGVRLVAAPGAPARYEFPADVPLRARVGERVLCDARHAPNVRATVAARAAESVVLELEVDLGPAIDAIVVRRDAAWLQEALQRRLMSVLADVARAAPSPFKPGLALSVLQPDRIVDRCSGLSVPPEILSARAPRVLNEAQLDAVRHVLGRPVTMIWGPPGCGKTTTVSAAVAALAYAGRRTLVVTPSNVAADVLLEQLVSWLRDHPAIGYGVVQRVGDRVTRRLSPTARALVVPSSIIARLEEENDTLLAMIAEMAAASTGAGSGDRSLAQALLAERQRLGELLGRHRLVTVAPIAHTYLSNAVWREYDVVVCEEASAVNVPSLVLAAGLARERLVIAGDPAQFGPVVQATTDAARSWLGRNAFQVAQGAERIERGDPEFPAVMLVEQHRMTSVVAELVSEDYYLGRLRTAHGRPPRVQWSLGERSVMVVDTSDLGPYVLGTRANPVHARVVAEVVRRIREDDGGTQRLGVFAMYHAHVHLLKEHLDGFEAVEVSTVHSAQGAEVDAAIVDLSDAPPGAAPTFLRANRCEEDGGRLLCVALTRARDGGVVIVANVRYLERAGGAVVRRLLARAREVGEVIDARTLLGENVAATVAP